MRPATIRVADGTRAVRVDGGQARRWMDDGTRLFLGALADLGDDDLGRPLALPGWTGRLAGLHERVSRRRSDSRFHGLPGSVQPPDGWPRASLIVRDRYAPTGAPRSLGPSDHSRILTNA